ncbi:O-antigen/teichoic acid export membrane protein [Flavobacterium granuli]|uniref:O-antigen/teichoic acid export membrane protein n=1 Tax=Flavobacterium granuli TaxID=280093 RepID=A0ABU1S7E4_9FLAO|nr:O-antigen/teichoic acid export membrane protein [Flavobacterium granuli]
MARILLPDEFGILGIISVFIAVSNTFINSGLSDALINKKDTSDKDYSTVFWANVLLGIFIYLLLFVSAPYISIFFKQDTLTLLIRITAISIIIVSFSSIQRTLLTKEINFKTITVVSTISVIISGIVALYMAFKGYGILSLVVRMVLGQFITLLLFWILNNWRPKFIFDFKSFKELYKYGANLFMSRLMNSLYDNLYYFVIGKYFSPANLGYYSRADTFKNLASSNIINTVQRVSFSTLSAKTDDIEQMKLFKKFLSGTFFITSFFMTLLFVCSNEIILILIGVKWADSIPYLKILSISGLFIPLYAVNINFLAVKNRTKLYFKIELITKLFAIPIIFIGISFGINTMLIGIIIVSFLSYLTSVYFVQKLFNYSYKSQFSLILKGSILILFSLILTYCSTFFEIKILYSLFIMNTTLILIVYLIGLLLLFPDLVIELKKLKK